MRLFTYQRLFRHVTKQGEGGTGWCKNDAGRFRQATSAPYPEKEADSLVAEKGGEEASEEEKRALLRQREGYRVGRFRV